MARLNSKFGCPGMQPGHCILHRTFPLRSGAGVQLLVGGRELLPPCRSTLRFPPAPWGPCPAGIAVAVPHAQGEAACSQAAKRFTRRLLASSVCNAIASIPGISLGGCSPLGRCPLPRHFGPRGRMPDPLQGVFLQGPRWQGLFGRPFFCKLHLQDPPRSPLPAAK